MMSQVKRGLSLSPVVAPAAGRMRRLYFSFAVLISAIWLTCLVLLGSTARLPSPWLLMLYSALVIAAEHRDRLFGDETSMSASVAVAIASVLVFRESSPLFGPLACASCAGLYWPHLRVGAISKVAINCASIGLSALAAATVYDLILGADPSVVEVFAVCLPMVAIYWIVNSSVLAIAMALLERGKPFAIAVSLVRSETEMLLFAVGGAACGLVYSELSAWSGVLLLIALLVAADRLVLSRAHEPVPGVRSFQIINGTRLAIGCSLAAGAGFVANEFLSVGAVVVGVVAGAGALFCWSTVAVWRRLRSWEFALAAGLVIPDLPIVVLMSVGGFLAATVGAVVALAVVAGGVTVGAIVLSAWPRRPVVSDPDEDLLITAAVELALLDRPNAPTTR